MSDSHDNSTALMQAVGQGDAQAVTRLLAAGCDVNAVVKTVVPDGHWSASGEGGETPLMLAADKGLADIARLLLAAGADANTSEKEGFTESRVTVLMRAARKGHTEVARALLAAGAQVDAADKYGTTALMEAAKAGHTDTARALLDGGANVNAATETGETALMQAAAEEHTDTMRLLLDSGADINAANSRGETALLHAARNEHIEALKLLIERGADANTTRTCAFISMELTDCIADGRQEQLEDINAAHAAVEQAEKDGSLAQLLLKVVTLNRAKRSGRAAAVRALLEVGADVNATDAQGNTALQLAEGNAEVVTLLAQAGAKALGSRAA